MRKPGGLSVPAAASYLRAGARALAGLWFSRTVSCIVCGRRLPSVSADTLPRGQPRWLCAACSWMLRRHPPLCPACGADLRGMVPQLQHVCRPGGDFQLHYVGVYRRPLTLLIDAVRAGRTHLVHPLVFFLAESLSFMRDSPGGAAVMPLPSGGDLTALVARQLAGSLEVRFTDALRCKSSPAGAVQRPRIDISEELPGGVNNIILVDDIYNAGEADSALSDAAGILMRQTGCRIHAACAAVRADHLTADYADTHLGGRWMLTFDED